MEEEADVGMGRLRMGFLGHWNPAWEVGSTVDHPPTMKFPLDPSSEAGSRGNGNSKATERGAGQAERSPGA